MPQIQLPIFPASTTPSTSELAFQERDSVVWYFNGHLPVFSHPVTDVAEHDNQGGFRQNNLWDLALLFRALSGSFQIPDVVATFFRSHAGPSH
jgi:hypothetical protein